jgi:NADH-quinone oxidoreductase subunit J
MADLFFYFFSALTVGSALGVVLNRNTVGAALCLLLSLLGTAGLFVLLNAYLLAVLLVLVYAGAVAALFVFVVMLLDMQGGAKRRVKSFTAVASVVTLALLFTGLALTFGPGQLSAPAPAVNPALGASLKLYGYQLFTTYLLPVQIVGFLLLAAMLGVIVLSRRYPGSEDAK